MSRNERGADVGGNATGKTVSTGVGDKLRHIGISLLPLGLFVGGALGYEQLITAGQSSGRQKATVAVSVPAAKDNRKATVVLPKQSAAAVPALSANSFRDERSLIDLVQAALPAPEKSDRRLDLILGDAVPLALAFDMKGPIQPGVYAVLRGVPQNALISHGIAFGSGSWLIDGGDLPDLAISMRSGTPGVIVLELSLLSRESRTLAHERVTLMVTAARPAPVSAHIVPPTPLAMPNVAPLLERPAPDMAQGVAQRVALGAPATPAPITAPANPNGMRLAVSSHAAGAGDDRNNLRLAIEPSGTVPDGAYVVLRGVPERSAMSRGLAIGPDVWLLTLLELGELELRLPEVGPVAMTLGAKLIAADGMLLAEETVRYEQVAASGVVMPAKADQAATRASAPVPARPAEVAAAQRTPPVTPQPQRSAAVTTAPSPEASRPGARIAAPTSTAATKPVALNVPSQQVALVRGRKMLETGNIAIARALLERAAGEGSAEAAALLGASFDAAWLKRSGVLGMTGDAAKATRWFEEARRMGAADVERIIAGISRR